MTTIGDSRDKIPAFAPEKQAHKEKEVSLLTTSIASKTLAPPSEVTRESMGKVASAHLITVVTKTAAKITRAAAGAGITTKLSPFVKRMVYHDPSDATVPIHDSNIYEVACIPGFDLGTSIDSDVRALAAKDIPLPSPFDERAFEEAKNQMSAVITDPLEKRVFQKVTDALQHITFPDLVQGLRNIIPRFNEAIGDTPFSAIVIPGKSNEWVTQIAFHEGLKLPDKVSVRRGEIDNTTPAYYQTVVIIDDGSYSGEQISMIMATICRPRKKIGSEYPPVTKFFVLVPFITTKAREVLLQSAVEDGVEIDILSHGSMPTFNEILTEEEAVCFKKLAYNKKEIHFGSTLAFTDWRRPDVLSAPTDFLKGEMYYTSAEGTSKEYKGSALVPTIVGPYKLREA